MKKLLITAGVLLLAAVFMSGCITAPASDDPIVGVWHAETDYSTDKAAFESLIIILNADGTGYSLAAYADELLYEKADTTWENLGDGKYSMPSPYTSPVALPQAIEFVLEGDVLTSVNGPAKGVFHREPVADFIPGLWTGGRTDFNEYTDIQGLIYFGEDGTGNLAVYGPAVLNLDEIFTTEFTWKAEGDKVILTGPKGASFDFQFVNGELVFGGLYPIHKYTVEDNLYGLWQSVEPVVEDGVSYDIVEVIKSDGTGTEIWTVPGSDAASAKYTFTWKMIDAVTYEAVYDDGDVWQFKAVYTQLFDGGIWYNKVGFDVLKEYAENKVTA